jgi:hypothetical protein
MINIEFIKFGIYDFFDVWQDKNYLFWKDITDIWDLQKKSNEILESKNFKETVYNQTLSRFTVAINEHKIDPSDYLSKKNIVNEIRGMMFNKKMSKEKLVSELTKKYVQVFSKKMVEEKMTEMLSGVNDWVSRDPEAVLKYMVLTDVLEKQNVKFKKDGFYAPYDIFTKGNSESRPCILIKDCSQLDDYCIIIPLSSKKNDKNNTYIEIEENKQYIIVSKIQRVYSKYIYELNAKHIESTKCLKEWLASNENKNVLLNTISKFLEC